MTLHHLQSILMFLDQQNCIVCDSGDIESMPFIEALRQLSFSVGNLESIIHLYYHIGFTILLVRVNLIITISDFYFWYMLVLSFFRFCWITLFQFKFQKFSLRTKEEKEINHIETSVTLWYCSGLLNIQCWYFLRWKLKLDINN